MFHPSAADVGRVFVSGCIIVAVVGATSPLRPFFSAYFTLCVLVGTGWAGAGWAFFDWAYNEDGQMRDVV